MEIHKKAKVQQGIQGKGGFRGDQRATDGQRNCLGGLPQGIRLGSRFTALLEDFFEFYNLERPEPGSPKTKGFWGGNQSHQGRTPAEVHFGPNPIQGLAA